MEQKFFTVDEANQLLPKLRPVLEKLFAMNETLKAVDNDIRLLEEIWGQRVQEPRHQDHGMYKKKRELREQQMKRIEEQLARVNALGAIVKDLNLGLVDFYHEKEGVPVLLCWKYGESRVQYWHTLAGGYSGRRSLEELTIRTK
jgi:hypothetical protein